MGVGVLVLLRAPGLLQGISEALGFEVPANFLFLLALTLLLLVSVHLSWELSRLEDETRVLAEELALLRSSLERLQACVQRSKNASEDNQAPRVVDSE